MVDNQLLTWIHVRYPDPVHEYEAFIDALPEQVLRMMYVNTDRTENSCRSHAKAYVKRYPHNKSNITKSLFRKLVAWHQQSIDAESDSQ